MMNIVATADVARRSCYAQGWKRRRRTKKKAQLTNIKTGGEIGLENLKVVKRINTLLNDDNIKRMNCANVAAKCQKGISLAFQFKSDGHQSNTDQNNKLVDNVPAMYNELSSYKESDVSEAQIGSIMLFKPDITPEKMQQSLDYLYLAAFETLKNQLNNKEITQSDYETEVENLTTNKSKWMENKKEELEYKELHFTVLILKAKDGKSVSGIIQKQGEADFDPNVLEEKKATDGDVKYVPFSRKSEERNSANYFYTDKKANN